MTGQRSQAEVGWHEFLSKADVPGLKNGVRAIGDWDPEKITGDPELPTWTDRPGRGAPGQRHRRCGPGDGGDA